MIDVFIDTRGLFPLGERLEMLRETGLVNAVVPLEGPSRLRTDKDRIPYVVDMNRRTLPGLLALATRRAPFILDLGDHPPAYLGLKGGLLSRVSPAVRTAYSFVVRRATAILCRSRFHVPVLRLESQSPIFVVPDTVADWIFESQAALSPGHDRVFGTFGTSYASPSGRPYGWQMIELLARLPDYRCRLVVHGGGEAQLRQMAITRGVLDRLDLEQTLDMPGLVAAMGTVSNFLSFQTDDPIGWVRTTAKLPIALALGRRVLATPVGEASVVLPPEWHIGGYDDGAQLDHAVHLLEAMPTSIDPAVVAARAEPFRRSTSATTVARYLSGLGL